MSAARPSPDEIRDYLLRRLPDAKRARFEEAYFSDDALLDQVEEAEDGLVSDYVLGRLGTSDRRRFEESLLGTPYYRERVETTTRFRLQIAGNGAPRRGRAGAGRGREKAFPGRTGLAVAFAFLAILLLAALASALRLKSDLEKAHLRARELASAVPPPAAQEGVVPVTQTVVVAAAREAGAPVYRVARPIGTPLLLVFSRQLLPEAARTFEVTLRDGAGRPSWASGPQHAGPSDEGDLALRLPPDLPAAGRTAVLLSTGGGGENNGRLVGILDVSDKAP